MDNYPPREIINPKAEAKAMEESKVRRTLSNVAEHDKWEEKRQEHIKKLSANPKKNNTPASVIPILKSTRLKNEVNMNALGKGSWSALSFGMKNFEILKAQEALQDVKILKGKADGIFGSETEQAVKTFQNSYTPTNKTHAFYQLNNADGVVGTNTVLALDEAITEEWVLIDKIAFTQVTKTQSLEDCWNELFCDDTPDSTKERVKNTNRHLNDPVRAGEIIILPTTDNKSAELDILLEEATLASTGLAELTDEQAQLHHTYFEVLENTFVEYWNAGSPADGFAYMGATVGTIAPAMAEHLRGVSSTLSQLDKIFLDFMSKKMDKPSFIAQRKSVTDTLNKRLDNLTKKTLNIPIDQDFKKALGINSTKSLIHNAGEILENGSVEALGKRITNTAKWIKYTELAGRVAVGLNVASGVLTVATSCNGLESCVRESVKETGGVAGGWLGGIFGSSVGGAFVLGLTITSLPVILVVVGVPALTMGIVGTGAGKDLAEWGYELARFDELLKEVENKVIDDIPKEVEDYINNERFSGFAIPRGL